MNKHKGSSFDDYMKEEGMSSAKKYAKKIWADGTRPYGTGPQYSEIDFAAGYAEAKREIIEKLMEKVERPMGCIGWFIHDDAVRELFPESFVDSDDVANQGGSVDGE